MLHDNQRMLAIDFADDLSGSHALFFGHAGRRLVEEYEIGLAAQNQRKLHPLSLAVRELAHRLVGETA